MQTTTKSIISFLILSLLCSVLYANEISIKNLPKSQRPKEKSKFNNQISLRSFFDYSSDIGKYHKEKHEPESMIHFEPTFHIYKHFDIRLEMETVKEHYRDKKDRKQATKVDDLNIELALVNLSPFKQLDLNLVGVQDLEGKHIDKSFGAIAVYSYKPKQLRGFKFKFSTYAYRHIYDLEKNSTSEWKEYGKYELTNIIDFRYKITQNLVIRSKYKMGTEWDYKDDRIDYYKITQILCYKLPDNYKVEVGFFNKSDWIRLGLSKDTRIFSRIGLYF